MVRTPDNVSYTIHGHNGCNGSERLPHVHVRWHGKEVSVSLLDGSIIVGARNLDHGDDRKVEDWVRSNLYELNEEWKSKSDPNR